MTERDLVDRLSILMPDHPTKSICPKHRAVVTSSGRISRTAKQIYNLILAEAFSHLAREGSFEFPISYFLKALPSRNYDHLKEALRQLRRKEIGYDLLKKDGSGDFLDSSLLAESRIKDGVVRVHFAPDMRVLLMQPEVYARISLLISNNLSSGHSLTLYENSLLWLGGRLQGSSGLIKIKILRELFGCEEKYPVLSDFRKYVLETAVAEIHEKKCGLHITYKPYRVSRKIVGYTFTIKKTAEEEDDDIIEAGPQKKNFEELATEKERKESFDSRLKSEQAEDWYETLSRQEQDGLWYDFEEKNKLLLTCVNEFWNNDNTLNRNYQSLRQSFFNYCAINMGDK